MDVKKVYSVCGMCTVRCPIMVEVTNGEVTFIQGNPHVPAMKGAVCPRGAAGIALLKDPDRITAPMIRTGARGSGSWRTVTWEEALDYVASKIDKIKGEYGGRSIALTDRGGPFRDLHRALLQGIGTPNYCNHDASCARNVQHANLSLTGMGRKGVVYDLKNAKHVVLQLRNIFEAINVQEVNNLTDAMNNGCKLTVIDIRANVSATKADRFFMIRPGTDYAFNLGVIHELLQKKLYDTGYASRYIQDLDHLERFVKPYTPEWAEAETGIPAESLREFVRDIARARPSVIWHPGWMAARYRNSFYVSRSIYIINALLGAFGAKGGLPLTNKPEDAGHKGLKSLRSMFPKPQEKRADGAGWQYPHIDDEPGLAHLLYKAMETDNPYPVKAYIAYRHDPLMAFPEPDRLKRIFDRLELLVSVTFSWSDTAWYSDVVLPLSTYLERESIVAVKNGLKPYFFVRNRAVEPRHLTKSDWEIVCGLAKRLSLPALAFDGIETIREFQLQGTGIEQADFEATGFVPLSSRPLYREPVFKTPSKKIEIISQRLEGQELPSLKAYAPPEAPPEDHFRLTFGRCAVHTQGHTVNNPMLSEVMPENQLWINKVQAEKLGISDGAVVTVTQNGYSEQIKAKVTDLIHPEAVFVIHGFGHRLPVETRAFGRGLADNRFMKGGLDRWDPAGGGLALQEHFVTVSVE